MRIFNRSTLAAFWKKYPDAEQPLRAWFHEVKKAAWRTPADVRRSYRTADFIKQRVVFDIRGNSYRLVVEVKYAPTCLVFVRFIGTHKEYDAIDVATV